MDAAARGDPRRSRRIVAAKEAGAPVLFTTRSYRRTLAWDDYALEREVRPGRGLALHGRPYFVQMERNGDVYPCVLHVGTFQPKNAAGTGRRPPGATRSDHSCFACYNTWLNENRAIFDLAPAVLANFWRDYLARRPIAAPADLVTAAPPGPRAGAVP